MNYSSPLRRGTIIRRYRRSLAEVRLDDGTVETVHSPGLGPMRGSYEPGRTVMVSDSNDPGRKHRLSWELIDIGGVWVAVNPLNARRVIQEAIEQNLIPTFSEYSVEHETSLGAGKKADLILQGMENTCFINAYGVSWGVDGTAWFPDNSNARLRKEFHNLAEIPKRGHRAIAFFLVQRDDCAVLEIPEDAQQSDQEAIRTAKAAGVEFLVYQAKITFDSITLGDELTFDDR